MKSIYFQESPTAILPKEAGNGSRVGETDSGKIRQHQPLSHTLSLKSILGKQIIFGLKVFVLDLPLLLIWKGLKTFRPIYLMFYNTYFNFIAWNIKNRSVISVLFVECLVHLVNCWSSSIFTSWAIAPKLWIYFFFHTLFLKSS